jgi:ADP-ribosylglycohydrolase
MNLVERVVGSALWAAYGDALGFITELRDAEGLKARVKASRVDTTVGWRRPIGGRFGAWVDLPAGCYSDDTQLRLATARAIRGDGLFDVEAFAKVELPVWLCYSLGAGRSTKAAAFALTQQNVNWFSNFFEQGGVRYLDAGGNGAAMRIQPHVWSAATASDPTELIRDVIRNAVCTHGHPRGILGAVIHALSLNDAVHHREIPGPSHWLAYIDRLQSLPDIVRTDRDLTAFWLPVWEDRTRITLHEAIETVQQECREDIKTFESLHARRPERLYSTFMEAIGALTDAHRGSATKTAIAAVALGWLHQKDPNAALLESANLLHSDTDSIATMAGAILGAVVPDNPVGNLLDREYIEAEARRLVRTADRPAPSFDYPDLLTWEPPKTQLDAVGRMGDRLGLAGLGFADLQGKPYSGRSNDGAVWQWMRLDFGQQVIAKRRREPKKIPTQNWPRKSVLPQRRIDNIRDQSAARSGHHMSSKPSKVEELDLFRPSAGPRRSSLDDLTGEAIRSGFDPSVIGRHILMLSELPDGVECVIAYGAIIAKAVMSRAQAVRRRGDPNK